MEPPSAFVRRIADATGGRGLYAGGEPPGAADRRLRLLGILEEAVRAAGAPELLDDIAAHVEAARDELFAGVNGARPDAGDAWTRERWALVERTVGVGAVHLELGTWTAFPDDRVAEIVAGDRLAEFIRLDADPDHGPDVVADATALPFRSGAIDRIASNSLVEHVSEPRALVAEAFRVLRPGGLLITVMPFVIKLHGYPHDYVRLTPQWWERTCREAGFEQVVVDRRASSGLFNTLHNALKMSPADATDPAAAAVGELHTLATLLLGALVPLDRRLVGGGEDWMHSVSSVAVKPGPYAPSGRAPAPGAPLPDRIVDLLADPATKAPVRRDARRLVSDEGEVAFHLRGGTPVFTEPAGHRSPAPEAGGVARRVRRRIGGR